METWGIWMADRAYAAREGDPLLAVVVAPSKYAAEACATARGVRSDGGYAAHPYRGVIPDHVPRLLAGARAPAHPEPLAADEELVLLRDLTRMAAATLTVLEDFLLVGRSPRKEAADAMWRLRLQLEALGYPVPAPNASIWRGAVLGALTRAGFDVGADGEVRRRLPTDPAFRPPTGPRLVDELGVAPPAPPPRRTELHARIDDLRASLATHLEAQRLRLALELIESEVRSCGVDPEQRGVVGRLCALGLRGDPAGELLARLATKRADEAIAAVAPRVAAPPAAPARENPVCTTCSDTHRMVLADENGEHVVMCTRCPTPCLDCRGRDGAYCATTPCACACHATAATTAEVGHA